MAKLKIFTFVVLVSLSYLQAEAQIIQYGFKGGLHYSWISMDDPAQQKTVSNSPVIGYNIGVAVAFKVRKRYFLHTELLYSTKGKNVSGITDPSLTDHVTYRYIDMPMLYTIQFKRNLNSATLKQFKWYIGAGPILSYWLGGSGTVNNTELAELGLPAINYNLKFGTRGESRNEINTVYVSDANRIQVGFNFGGGIMLEPLSGKKIVLDARLEIGQSWLGKANSTDYVLPATYKDNLKSTNMGLRFSLMYLFESNLAKKVKNKGKTQTGGRVRSGKGRKN
jgi:hypothetical protein